MAGTATTRRVEEGPDPTFCEHHRLCCPFCGLQLVVGHDHGQEDLVFMHEEPHCIAFDECDNDVEFNLIATHRVLSTAYKHKPS
jgi:hypothetical protein